MQLYCDRYPGNAESLEALEGEMKWRAIYIETSVKDFGWLQTIYGTDIFVNGIPLLKIFLALNLLIHVLL